MIILGELRVFEKVGQHLDHILLTNFRLKAWWAHHLVQGKDLQKTPFEIAKLLFGVLGDSLESCRFEAIGFELSSHELIEALFSLGEDVWDDRGADSLDEAQQTALHVFVVVSQKLVDTFVEVLFYGDDEPLRVHFEKQKEVQNCFSTENNRLVLKKLADRDLIGLVLLECVV